MRAPPPFEIMLRDAPVWRVLQAGLWALAAAGLGAWLAAAWIHARGAVPGAGPSETVGGVVAAAVWAAVLAGILGGAAGWRLGRPVQALLRWSGQRFELLDGDAWRPAALGVMLDLGTGMLLRVQPPGGRARWIGWSSRSLDASGHLLRAALYCSARVDPGRADEDRARS